MRKATSVMRRGRLRLAIVASIVAAIPLLIGASAASGVGPMVVFNDSGRLARRFLPCGELARLECRRTVAEQCAGQRRDL